MTVRILHVEDSLADLELVSEVLESLGADVAIDSAPNGNEALVKLLGPKSDAGAPHPDLILLDLNLPLRSGHDVLAAVKADARTCGVPVVVLTTSRAPEDIRRCYVHGASAYLVKPYGLQGMRRVMAALKAFWIDAAALARPDGVRLPADDPPP